MGGCSAPPTLAAHLEASECVLWPGGTKGSKQGLGGQGRAGVISSLCDMKAHRLQATSVAKGFLPL